MIMTDEVRERFMKIDPAQVGHFLKGNYMHPRIKPISKYSKIIGPAYTVRTLGKDNNAVYYAMQKAAPGSVIVIDRGGDDIFACLGEMVATVAKSRGMAGLVVDGPATDSLAIEEMGFPVFCSGLSPVTTNIIGVIGEVDVPVQCGGAVVNPGDYIFGDADGVVVIPGDRCVELLEKAEAETADEVYQKEYIEKNGFVPINVEKIYETDILQLIRPLRKVD